MGGKRRLWRTNGNESADPCNLNVTFVEGS
jgi:hypothetical protein